MKVRLNLDYCVASGACVLEAPEVFGYDADGGIVLLDEHPPPALRDKVLRAVAICPTKAIEVEEDDPADR